MCIRDSNIEEWPQHLKFYGDENDNPVEFVRQCERSIDTIVNQLTDQDKINLITKYF